MYYHIAMGNEHLGNIDTAINIDIYATVEHLVYAEWLPCLRHLTWVVETKQRTELINSFLSHRSSTLIWLNVMFMLYGYRCCEGKINEKDIEIFFKKVREALFG